MKTEHSQAPLQGTERQTTFADILIGWDETCKNCHTITPIRCIMGCKIWKQRNEFRKIYEIMRNPGYMTKLLNTLKNKRRFQILEITSKGRYSIAKLQQELKKLGYYHSRQTIAEEYLTPLIEVGLAEEDQSRYHATVFGCRLNELIKNSHDVEKVLPPHSECYEETALGMLLDKPKTYEDLEGMIPAKSVARVLNRLQKARLIETAKENDYVFYFRTKRDSNSVNFSPTERRVYENIPMEGISARKLAEKTGISLRRTYKYLRRLKGKKMVFAKKRPKSYALTAKGLKIAEMLKEIRDLALEALATASQIVNINEQERLLTLATPQTNGTLMFKSCS